LAQWLDVGFQTLGLASNDAKQLIPSLTEISISGCHICAIISKYLNFLFTKAFIGINGMKIKGNITFRNY
jgi:hypothetical protein